MHISADSNLQAGYKNWLVIFFWAKKFILYLSVTEILALSTQYWLKAQQPIWDILQGISSLGV